jgi:hypothetical protein
MSKELTGAKSWEDIVARYDDLVQRHDLPYEPMVQLVRRLAAAPSSPELERNTSVLTL